MAKKEQIIRTYEGLSAEFCAVSWAVCQHTLTEDAWQPWRKLVPLVGVNGEQLAFPSGDGTIPADRLEAVDRYLFELLLPKNIAPNPRMKGNHIRADLNKYKGWLLNRILAQMHRLQQGEQQSSFAYILPEDLPKIVDDLYLFHKHIKGTDANIAQYKSLKDLHTVVKPFQPKYPLIHEDRHRAHAAYLQTETPEQLLELLPQGWTLTKTGTHIRIPDGSLIIARVGGALLEGITQDGTEVIRIDSHLASVMYGSPRWCTAWKATDAHFNTHQHNLLVVLESNGNRYQIHLASDQWMDTTDTAIDGRALLNKHRGLEEVVLLHPSRVNEALIWASKKRCLESLTTILEVESIDVNLRDRDGTTA